MKVVYNKNKAQRVNELSELKDSLEEIDLLLDGHSTDYKRRVVKVLVLESKKNFSIIEIFRTIRDIIIKLTV